MKKKVIVLVKSIKDPNEYIAIINDRGYGVRWTSDRLECSVSGELVCVSDSAQIFPEDASSESLTHYKLPNSNTFVSVEAKSSKKTAFIYFSNKNFALTFYKNSESFLEKYGVDCL